MIDKSLIEERTFHTGYISYFKNDRWFMNTLNQGQIYEQDYVLHHLTETIKNSNVIIDAGAHAGSHTVLYKYINPNATIHAFEPQKKMFELLEHNVSQNNFSNVFLYNYALANMEKTSTLANSIDDLDIQYSISYGTDEVSNLGGIKIGHGGEEMRTMTIDSLNLPACDFIKMDVEGAEALTIYGAIETIKKFKPTILFESNHQEIDDDMYLEFNAVKRPVHAILYDLGYKQINCIDNLHNYLAVWG